MQLCLLPFCPDGEGDPERDLEMEGDRDLDFNFGLSCLRGQESLALVTLLTGFLARPRHSDMVKLIFR